MKLEDMALLAAMAIAGLLLVVLLIGLFVYIPITEYTRAQCLEAGYPKAQVAYNFKRYCTNLTGSVTVKVEKLK